MNRWVVWMAAAAAIITRAEPAPAQATSGLDRLYILNCGEGVAGDISRWSPGVNVGKSMEFVDNCYLLRHQQGWLLWDTGVTDAIAANQMVRLRAIRERPIGVAQRHSHRSLTRSG